MNDDLCQGAAYRARVAHWARRIDELGVPADLKPGTILVCRLADETWLRIGHRYLVRDVQRDNRGAPLVVLEGLPDIVWGAWRFQGVEQ